MNKVEHWQLMQRQSQPLDIKIKMSLRRIKQWHEYYDGEVYVAFSGGLDSTALLHLVRSLYPGCVSVFNNTGLEFPEIIKFVRQTANVVFLNPKKRFRQIVSEYGYPVPSKRVSKFIHEVKHARSETYTKNLRLTGIARDGKY
ncbi:MAG: phosphoadenosine phosphosulfate reductase domain-containing protein, partial [Candidatus Thorarchaeota archaeon]